MSHLFKLAPSLRRIGVAIATLALGIVFLAVMAPAAPAEAQACTLAPTNGPVEHTIKSPFPLEHGGLIDVDRTYILYVPPGLTGSAPLMVLNHGANATAENIEQNTGWDQYATDHHFIVAYSRTLVRTDQLPIIGPVIGSIIYPGNVWFFNQDSFDVAYLKNVVADIKSSYCVDAKRVYNWGFSEGAIMANRMACDAPDVFAAAVSWEGSDATVPSASSLDAALKLGLGPVLGLTPLTEWIYHLNVPVSPCNPSRPIAVGVYQGDQDLFSQQPVGRQNVYQWNLRNGCPTDPSTTQTNVGYWSAIYQYSPCAAGITEVWQTMAGEPHGWPSDPAKAAALRDAQWNYLSSYILP
ncbi:poly(3-hydroxybutyrate) depolymerase [Nocardia pseudobrasiliensis]|uniref:Poly(3-hydroxybutyrate) depolymerase n=2 Tax=Nocardia pseudobrasiliensis TaxID=45979 RepID=A0A370IAD5_9NOCA|nr:hypothetical protein [Nocardia pseudobrasiliensis]RDI67696.1 poly(3-hydroxybutyrate) depolymerase [Nocardia pseudobrasiliensis]